MNKSPRKTRSRSRLVAAKPGDDQATNRPRIRLVFPTYHPPSIPTIPVMTATSMEPVLDAPVSTEKRPRHKMTGYQLQRLEELYRSNTHPSRDAKEALANEVGMTFKSVLIWFQNRRQDRPRKKRASEAGSGSPARKRAKTDSEQVSAHSQDSITGDPGPQLAGLRTITFSDAAPRLTESVIHLGQPPASASCQPAPVSLLWHSSDLHQQPLSFSTYPPSAIAAGPPASTTTTLLPSNVPTYPPFPQPFANASNRPASTNLHSRSQFDLEWACANSAARRDHDIFAYRDEDDSAEDSSDLESDVHRSDERRHPRAARPKLTGRRVRIAVPREYHALFSPDVVQGASLLLSLKHSEE